MKEASETVAFIHVDCDLYSSTKTILDNLKPYIKSNTVIVFDEFLTIQGGKRGNIKLLLNLLLTQEKRCVL